MRTALLSASAAALCLVGCQSYDILQTNVFSDDDGYIVTVEYGRSESDHTNTFIAPTNGQEMEFKSKLVVRVHLPDGDSFKAWQCMNFTERGTMYRTDDKEWMFLATGFGCQVYHLTKDGDRYAEVYRGVICEAPKSDYEADERWRTLKKGADGKWK